MSKKDEQLKEVRDKVWNLTKSPLYTYRKENNYYPVLGEGNHDADVMFVGEAPGENEAKTGKPFCGAAGRILDELFASVGANRQDAYVTNIVKDRPPKNRDPQPEEIELYAPFLVEQINIIQPKVIATLGRFSMQYILTMFDLPEKNQTISHLHGKSLEAKTAYGSLLIVPLYHPAVALYSSKTKETLLNDFKILIPYLS